MTALDYDNAEFNVDEYLQLWPDLTEYWQSEASIKEPQWGGDIRFWAASHWQTHGRAEGRQGRISVWQPPMTEQAAIDAATVPVSPAPITNTAAAALAAAQAAKQKDYTWLWYVAAFGLGWYLYRNRSR